MVHCRHSSSDTWYATFVLSVPNGLTADLVPKILLRPRDGTVPGAQAPAMAVVRCSPLDPESNTTPSSGSQREDEAGPSSSPLYRKRSRSQSTPPSYTDSKVDELENDTSEDEVENVRTANAKLEVKGKGKAQEKRVEKTVKREASEDTAAPLERPAKKARVKSPLLREIKLPVDKETRTDLLCCDRCKAGRRKCVRSTRWPCDDCARF